MTEAPSTVTARLVGGPADGSTYAVPHLDSQIRVYTPVRTPIPVYADWASIGPATTEIVAEVAEYIRADLLVAEPARSALWVLNNLANYHIYVYAQNGSVW